MRDFRVYVRALRTNCSMGEAMKTAFLFPGQGAQTIGMGQDLYDNNIIYKETFETCMRGADLDLAAACFDGKRMDESEVVQPAIFAHSISLLEALRSESVDADIYAGLSLGEYTALTASGVFDTAQCAALVRERGRIMDGAFPTGTGGMLSVIGFDVDRVEEMIKNYDNAYVANHLSELQTVVAGFIDDLKELELIFNEAGAKMVTILGVRGPSHAPLLNTAADAFFEVLSSIDTGDMQKPVYANALGRPYDQGSNIAMLLSDQMRSRVRWHDCVESMIENGVERFVEVGPSNVLTKLVKRRVGKGGAETYSVRDAATLDKFLNR